MDYAIAPELRVSEWLNTAEPLSLSALRGKVVMICAFQMLCPGCVSQGLPQASRVSATFRREDVAVIGLHSVFEHHEAMPPVALRAFLHEYRIGFPVGIDAPNGRLLPQTMRAYGMEGTPTTLLIDRKGGLRRQVLGHIPDLQLGAEIMQLIAGKGPEIPQNVTRSGTCSPDGCV